MPSRAVEAALLLSVTLAATVLAFIVLRPLLFPRKALDVETMKTNLVSLAMLLDKNFGGMRLQTRYTFKTNGYAANITLQAYEAGFTTPSWSFNYIIPLPTIIAQLDESKVTMLLYGDPEPYSNATASTVVYIDKDLAFMFMRPIIHVEECSFYFFRCNMVVIQIPVLSIQVGGKTFNENTFAEGQTIEVFLNSSNTYSELKYCQRLELIVEVLSPEGRTVELLGIPLRRQLTVDLGENGIIVIQYVLKKIVVKT